MKKYVVIMAGGVGSRFWPASTKEKPKQFLDILGTGKSLIKMTVERCNKLIPNENILIITNKIYESLVMEELPNIPKENILCEPSMNNTAPCILYSALRIKSLDPNSVIAVLPSDHVILKENEFLELLNDAFELAYNNDYIVTMGIKPSRPDTGYGYISYDKFNTPHKVFSFKEKPNIYTAKSYVDSGDYLWNAGMFIWSVKTILESYKKYAKDIYNILCQDEKKIGTSEEQEYIDKVYPLTQKISVDFAILERAENVYTIPADISWSDLGTWNSLYEYLVRYNSNVTIGNNIHVIDSHNNIIVSNNSKNVIVKGMSDYIIVDDDKALLIYPKNEEQTIKEVVKNLN